MTALQRRALREAGCERFFDEAASGGWWNRPELHRMLNQLRPGDVVVVWKLDRLSRSLKDLLHLFDCLKGAGAGFCSLTQAIDITTAAGTMFMQMCGTFAEYERAMIGERTKADQPQCAHARRQRQLTARAGAKGAGCGGQGCSPPCGFNGWRLTDLLHGWASLLEAPKWCTEPWPRSASTKPAGRDAQRKEGGARGHHPSLGEETYFRSCPEGLRAPAAPATI